MGGASEMQTPTERPTFSRSVGVTSLASAHFCGIIFFNASFAAAQDFFRRVGTGLVQVGHEVRIEIAKLAQFVDAARPDERRRVGCAGDEEDRLHRVARGMAAAREPLRGHRPHARAAAVRSVVTKG